jgi:hypothetical protein
MQQIFFKYGTFGKTDRAIVLFSHSGDEWNKFCNENELEYWIKTYNSLGYNVTFKA